MVCNLLLGLRDALVADHAGKSTRIQDKGSLRSTLTLEIRPWPKGLRKEGYRRWRPSANDRALWRAVHTCT